MDRAELVGFRDMLLGVPCGLREAELFNSGCHGVLAPEWQPWLTGTLVLAIAAAVDVASNKVKGPVYVFVPESRMAAVKVALKEHLRRVYKHVLATMDQKACERVHALTKNMTLSARLPPTAPTRWVAVGYTKEDAGPAWFQGGLYGT